MSINLSCRNTICKFYWEDCCTEHMANEVIFLNKNGKCENFEIGTSDLYKLEKEVCPECCGTGCSDTSWGVDVCCNCDGTGIIEIEVFNNDN